MHPSVLEISKTNSSGLNFYRKKLGLTSSPTTPEDPPIPSKGPPIPIIPKINLQLDTSSKIADIKVSHLVSEIPLIEQSNVQEVESPLLNTKEEILNDFNNFNNEDIILRKKSFSNNSNYSNILKSLEDPSSFKVSISQYLELSRKLDALGPRYNYKNLPRFRQYFTKDELYEEEASTPFIFAKQVLNKKGEIKPRFFTCDYIDMFVRIIHERALGLPCPYFECVETSERKSFLDLDLDFTPANKAKAYQHMKALLKRLLEVIKETFSEKGIDLPDSKIRFHNSSTDTKFSFHINIEGYKHKCHKEAKAWRNLIHQKIGPLSEFEGKIGSIIDHAVYGSTQQIRLPMCHKLNKTNYKEFIGETPLDPPRLLEDFKKDMISFIHDCVEMPMFLTTTESQRSFIKSEDLSEVQGETLEKLFYNFQGGILSRIYKLGDQDGAFWKLIHLGGPRANCPICDRAHQAENGYLKVYDGHGWFDCRRSNGKSIKIGRIFEPIENTPGPYQPITEKDDTGGFFILENGESKPLILTPPPENRRSFRSLPEIMRDYGPTAPENYEAIRKFVDKVLDEIEDSFSEQKFKEWISTSDLDYSFITFPFDYTDFDRELTLACIDDARLKYRETKKGPRTVDSFEGYNPSDPLTLVDVIRKFNKHTFGPDEDGYEIVSKTFARVFRRIPGKNVCVKRSPDNPCSIEKVPGKYTYGNHCYSQEKYVRDEKGKIMMKEDGRPETEIESRFLFTPLSDNISLLSDKFVFKPFHYDQPLNLDINKEFNIFPGYRARLAIKNRKVRLNPTQLAKIQPYLDHIKNVYCDGKDDLYRYILSYISYIFRTGRKPKKCLILIGDQGCGKNFLFELIGEKILGFMLYTSLNSMEPAVGRFNSIISNKLLIVINEARNIGDGKSFKSVFEKFKDMITNDYATIEPKGIDILKVEDFTSYIITTNNNFVMPIPDDDRRFIILYCSNMYCRQWGYFKSLIDAFTDEVADILYTYFIGEDIKEFLVDIDNIPETDAKINSKERSKEPLPHFCEEMIEHQTIELEVSSLIICNRGVFIPFATLYDLYKSFMNENYRICKTIPNSQFSGEICNGRVKLLPVTHKRQFKYQGKNYNGFLIDPEAYSRFIVDRGSHEYCTLLEYLKYAGEINPEIVKLPTLPIDDSKS